MTHVTVVIPAHNEAEGIVRTLNSLSAQTIRPHRIIVVADNCTDDTAEVASRWGASAIATIGNHDKKAGALNQVVPQALRTMPAKAMLLVMDADSTLNESFIENALATFDRDDRIGAVSSTFYGEQGCGFIGLLQRMEYEQYAFEVRRRRDTLVLSGTATVFRADVLRRVAHARGDHLPGQKGAIYYTNSITEDNELTLAIKKLGWRTVQPQGCDVLTEVMPNWRMLFKQRLRWKRGTLEDVRLYGVNKLTRPYLLQQFELAVSTFARVLLVIMLLTVIGTSVEWRPWWSLVGLVFVVIPVLSVRKMGRVPMIVAALVIPQLLYRVFQEYVLLVAYYQIYLHIEAKWHHLNKESDNNYVRNWWHAWNGRRDGRARLHRHEPRLGRSSGIHAGVRGHRHRAVREAAQAAITHTIDPPTRVLYRIEPPTRTVPRPPDRTETTRRLHPVPDAAEFPVTTGVLPTHAGGRRAVGHQRVWNEDGRESC